MDWLRCFKTKATEVRKPTEDGNPTEGRKPTKVRKPTEVAETPKLFLQLTTKCMEQASRMTSSRSSSSPNFNQEQCIYLAGKLKMAVQSAHSIFELINTWYFLSASLEEMASGLEIFELLYATGMAVEGFIQSCCKDAWIQSAIMLTNALEHVVSLGFNLELSTIIFLNRKLGMKTSLTFSEVASVREAEAEIVKEMANLDEKKLCSDLNDMIQPGVSSSVERQLATLLLGRLKSARLHPVPHLAASNRSSHPEMVMSSLRQMESLGKGASAVVHKAIWLGVEVAKKTFHGPRNPDFLQEVSILEGLSHPNIVSLLWYMTDERKCQLIMELMDGDLYTLMQDRLQENGNHGPPFNILEALDIMLQVAEGVFFLHEKKIVHRDLKSHNIMVKCGKATGVDVNFMEIKVADFGLSKTKEKSQTYSNQTRNQGTTRWMAPEMIKFGNYDVQLGAVGLKYPFKSDIYSFGMVCFEILTGDVPFSTLNPREVKKVILGGDHPQLPDDCPNRLRTLIESCWSSKASTRPSIGDICVELRQLKCERLMTSAWSIGPHCFSLDEIRRMTNDFNENNRIGSYEVFKGVMVVTGKLVAVERVQYNCNLLTSCTLLEVLHHENLVEYVGYCDERGKQTLVFEYMPNYTLAGWLLGNEERVFYDWPVRRNICLGVANGIHYLHTKALPKYMHRPINLHTIFLDANLKPKIGGFWSGHPATECEIEKQREKEDVYNYGVLLLEVVSRRIARNVTNGLQEWARILQSRGEFVRIIDPSLRLQVYKETEAVRMIKIGLLCIHSVAETRPDMTRVVAMLQGNLDAEITSLGVEHEREISELERVFASRLPRRYSA